MKPILDKLLNKVRESDTVYDGDGRYSMRFGETVNATDIGEALDQIFEFTSTDPTTSLSLNPSAAREKGDTLASVSLTATNSTGQNPVGTLTELIFRRGAGVLDTIVNPSGSENYNETTAVTDTTTFSSVLTDSEARSDTSNRTITFLYPLIYCVGPLGYSAQNVYDNATKILSSNTSRTLTYTTTNQTAYYAFPASLASLTEILDINGFSVISDWDMTTENVVGLDGTTQSYKLYSFQNVSTGSMDYDFS